jgi:hypothetical protein
MAKRKGNEKTIVDIILHKTLKMGQNDLTIFWGSLSYSQCVGYSCFSRGTRRITNVDILVISHIRWRVMSEVKNDGIV